MPSVGMRRSTRVFVPKAVLKDADGATVLRSGKRLWSLSSDDAKPDRGGNEDEWFPMIQSSKLVASDVSSYKSNGWSKVAQKNDVSAKHSRKKIALTRSRSKSKENATVVVEEKDKMYGTGYGRKRPINYGNRNASSSLENRVVEDRMFGFHFFRKRRRKTALGSLSKISAGVAISVVDIESQDLAGNSSLELDKKDGSLAVIVEPSYCCAQRFTCFLVSLLNFMRRSRVRGSKLAAFMCSDPIAQVFSQNGIHFLSDLFGRKSTTFVTKIFKVWGAQDFVPIFSLNFSAIPLTFMSLHFRMFLSSRHQLDVLVRYLMELPMKPQRLPDGGKRLWSISTEMGLSLSRIMASIRSKKRGVKAVDRGVLSGERRRSMRHNAKSKKFKKRTSRRSLRVKSPSMAFLQKGGDEVADMFDTGKCCSSFPILESNNKQKHFQGGLYSNNITKELNQNMESICCGANILVIEFDRCYREKGANIMLECSASKEWYLAVKIQGTIRYMHKAQDVMRPSTTSRFTHAMIWSARNGWKLEFSDRRDWFIFKELHRECVDRNVQAASAREVPVPRIHEIRGHGDEKSISFVQPNAYIKMHDNEVTRSLTRNTANYDIDSGDEEWIKKLNNDLFSRDDGPLNHVSDEKFEEMIDVFEKAAYCTPDDVSDENRATKLCSDLRTDIVTAVYQYWVEKRKRRDSALLRVFQCAPPRVTHVLQKPFLRKRRSFKRQASKYGKSNQRTFLQAFADELEKDAVRRVQEAKNSERTSIEVAILTRKRAQELVEIADLATYKATFALKIAEAAQLAVSADAFVSDIFE